MSSSDENGPNRDHDLSSPDAGQAEPPAFSLPAIPIAPPRAIDAPASRALAPGENLFEFGNDPLRHGDSRPPRHIAIPDALNLELFANLAQLEIKTDSAPIEHPAEHFPITPIKPFAASADAEALPDAAASIDIQESSPQSAIAPPEFRLEPEPESRIPNFGHLLILGVIALFGFVAAGLSVQLAFRAHLWGVTTIDQAATDIHYTLASMAVLYGVAFAVAFFLFPHLWHKSFFAGLQWNAGAAVRYRNWLFAAAGFCFVLAMVDELILPGPTNAPIDKMFSNTAAAWLLFVFGVTVAPLFEEMTFRGFLLPALCTAVDWALNLRTTPATSLLTTTREKQRLLPLGPDGHPQWSIPAMIVGSLLTSLPFAAMHADQIAHSIGPLILLYCVSLVLCFSRLATRSLAASTLVHASYNFILFSFMLVGTGGFRHLDKM